jgi:hypothetical protein
MQIVDYAPGWIMQIVDYALGWIMQIVDYAPGGANPPYVNNKVLKASS